MRRPRCIGRRWLPPAWTRGTVGMVEAHGTGTPVGDPIEYASLAKVYGTRAPARWARSKTNFGHTQSAAGALGLIKAILPLQHGVVPPNLHFTRLPDDLTQIETETLCPAGDHAMAHQRSPAPRRAAVSSYGMSGTNVHAILEQAPETVAANAGRPDPAGRAAGVPAVVDSRPTSCAGPRGGWPTGWRHTRIPSALPDLAYTLARRRGHRPVRTAVVAGSPRSWPRVCGRSPTATPHIRRRSGRTTGDRYGCSPGRVRSGRRWVLSCWPANRCSPRPSREVEPLIARESGFSVTEAMSAPQTVTGIDRIQPTLFAMQVALAATMKSYGVRPGAVIGHSLGEAAAAVVAGALSLEDGVRVICRRSRLMSRIAGAGAMASVELPAQQVLSELMARGVNDVVVAVVASPQSTVIGGATQTVRELVAAWEQRDVMAPRGGRRRGIAFPASRSDPRRAGRRSWPGSAR